MNLFQLKTGESEQQWMAEFLKDNYVSIPYNGLGDLENTGREDITSRLGSVYGYEGEELESHAQAVHTFVHIMQDGDYVLVAEGDWVHLGDLGDYFYNEGFDTAEDGRCHRRGVTWLTSIPHAALNAGVQELLADHAVVSRFNGPIAAARLDLWVREPQSAEVLGTAGVKVDDATLAEALEILRQALKSADIERRERAAIAILQYAK